MIQQKEALNIVLASVTLAGTEEIELEKGFGKVLREDWYADRDLPPYDRVTMDGIAINFSGSQNVEELIIEGVAAAGSPRMTLSDMSACLEVMTGAVLPNNCNTVIRYEDLQITNGKAKIVTAYQNHKNVHYQGEDRKRGDLLVKEFTQLGSPEIGIGASIGKTKINVSIIPRVVIISTGDELVGIDQKPLLHQIRKSNVFRIAATLQKYGVKVESRHILDEYQETRNIIADCLEKFDAVILSGGVSKGKFDFVPEVLSDLGVNKKFHRVAQRPGKPFWFGTYESQSTVFALPGNPVSSFMCTYIYILPWLASTLGYQTTPQYAVLAEDYAFQPSLTYFLQVSIINDKGILKAYPRTGHGSGDFANLCGADAFLQLPDNRSDFKAGEVLQLHSFR